MSSAHAESPVEQTLREHLALIDQRPDTQVKPNADGGASVHTSLTAANPFDGLAAAQRAISVPGARLVEAQVQWVNGEVKVQATGEIDDVGRATPMTFADDGDLIYWVGPDQGIVPDLQRKLAEVLISASRDGLLNAALDVSLGGMATTVALMAIASDKGARIWAPEEFDEQRAFFDSSLGGIICIVPRTEELRFSDMCIARYLPSYRVGVVDGSDLEIQGHFTISVASLR